MKDVVATLAFALVNEAGLLAASQDGRAHIYADEEAATAAMRTDPNAEGLTLVIVSVNPPEIEEDVS